MLKIEAAKTKYELHVESTKKAKELRTLLNKYNVPFKCDLDTEELDWIFSVELSDDQLYILRDEKTIGEIAEALLAGSEAFVDNMSINTIKATKKLSPVVTHCLMAFCITSIKCGSIIINDSVIAGKKAKKLMEDNDEVVEAAENVVIGAKYAGKQSVSLFNWIKDKFNK